MEGGSTTTHSRTVEEVFEDFKGRRAGILKALTSDVEDFFLQCDPEKETLSLYGFPDEGWEVTSSTKEVPPQLPEPPEPALGINFARDRMQRKDWLSLVAAHSDSWMLAVSYFYSSHLGQGERKRLILLITELPTVFDVVTGKKPAGKKPSVNSTGESKSEPAGSKIHRAADAPVQKRLRLPKEQRDPVEEDEEEHGNDKLCAWQFCPDNYSADEFRRGCDFCEKWYHGKCIKVTPAMNEHIKRYRCPSCTMSRARMQ